jgi:TPR repeat protein
MSDSARKPDTRVLKTAYYLLGWRALEAINDAEAMFERGYRLRKGIGVGIDSAESWRYFEAAAELGHPTSIAFCFTFGCGVDKDDERAAALFRQAAELGHPACEAIRARAGLC